MKGVVVHFDADRGFGFIRSPELEDDVFVHVREVQDRQDLKPGQSVRFEVRKGEKGMEAHGVLPGARPVSPVIGFGLAAFFLAAVIALAITQLLQWPVLIAWLVGITLVTFLTYGFDKWRARRRKFRVPERVLHLEALFGGTVGALIAQSLFRHKTIKGSFRIVFWAIFALQIAAVVWYLIATSGEPPA